MSIFIKICGIKTDEAIDCCIETDVNAIGFVFEPTSKRYVTPAQAAVLGKRIPSQIKKIAVARTLTVAKWRELVEVFPLDGIQLDADELDKLMIPKHIEVLPVYRESQAPLAWPRRCLWEGLESGVGRAVNWEVAAQLARQTELVLAGGLSADNVAQAIAKVNPYGVDVSSGVEDALGQKSVDKISQFVRAARGAAAAVSIAQMH